MVHPCTGIHGILKHNEGCVAQSSVSKTGPRKHTRAGNALYDRCRKLIYVELFLKNQETPPPIFSFLPHFQRKLIRVISLVMMHKLLKNSVVPTPISVSYSPRVSGQWNWENCWLRFWGSTLTVLWPQDMNLDMAVSTGSSGPGVCWGESGPEPQAQS